MVRRWETGTQNRGNTRARSRSPTKSTSGAAAQRAFKSHTHTSEHRDHSHAFRRVTDNTGAGSPYSPKHARAVKSAGVGKKGNGREAKGSDGLLTLEELRGVLSGEGNDVSVASQSGRHGSPLRVRWVSSSLRTAEWFTIERLTLRDLLHFLRVVALT